MTVHTPEENSQSQPSQTWPRSVLTSLFFAGFLSVAAWNIELPYLAYSAGPVSDVSSSIQALGVEVHPPQGELLMLTVISQEVNVFEYLVAQFDPTIDLVKTEAVRQPGETVEQYRARSLQQMDDSNFRSIMAALAYLGYEMVPFEVSIAGIVEGVPAENVLEQGDIIIEVRGTEVGSAVAIREKIEGLRPGDTVEMLIRRSGEELLVTVELAEREDSPGTPLIGIQLDEATAPPFPLQIRSGNVGGPSAGMMHTLAIIDNLTEGELTRGFVVAGTGTIFPDGNVGAIGGVRQKVVAAEAAGASYILVPVDNYEDALTVKRSRIEIVAISSLQEALDFLNNLPDA